MKAVIYFLFKGDIENNVSYIDDTKKKLNYGINQYIITTQEQLPKSLHGNTEQIFYFKDQKQCFNNVKNVIDYLEILNYTEFLIINANKTYTEEDLIFESISTVKNNLSIITKLI